VITDVALVASVAALLAGLALVSASLQAISRILRALRAPLRKLGNLSAGFARVAGRLVPAGKKSKPAARSIEGTMCLARRLWVRDASSATLGPPDDAEAPLCEDLTDTDLIDDDGARVRIDLSALPWRGLPISSHKLTRDALVAQHPAIAAGLKSGDADAYDVYEVAIPSGAPVLIQGRARKGRLTSIEATASGATESVDVSEAYRDTAEGWQIDAEIDASEEAVMQFGSVYLGVFGRVAGASFALMLGVAVLAHTAAYLAIRWYERQLMP
jgi:hypothetical protein